MTVETLSTDQFEEFGVDGQWYVARLLVEELPAAARMLWDDGATDAEIGRLGLHFVHDLHDEGKFDAFTFKNSAVSGSFGTFAVVPNEHWYTPILELDRQRSHDGELWVHGLPTDRRVLELVEDELDAQGWRGDRLAVTSRHGKQLVTGSDGPAADVQDVDEAHWVIDE